jgi:hypothetical protein
MTRGRCGLTLLLAACWIAAGRGTACRAQADSTVYLPLQPGIISSNGARFWPTLAGTAFPTVMTLYTSVPGSGADYYTYSSPGGVIPWSDGILGDDQFVVYHPSDGTYWVAQAFSTNGSNVAGSGGGASSPGFSMMGSGTPVDFCGGGGRGAPVYWEITILSQVLPPTTALAASAKSIELGQPVTLTAVTTSPSGTLYAQAIDDSPDGSTWTAGTTVAGASWTGGPAARNTLSWTFFPPSVGTWYFRAAGTDSVGVSNSAVASVTVTAPPPPTGSITVSPASGAVPLAATIVWATANATSAVVAGSGLAGTALSGSQGVTLSAPGTYFYTLTAGGPGGQVTRSASVTATEPAYTVSTLASGGGSVTPGGTYPVGTMLTLVATPGPNATFVWWSGSVSSSANPLALTVNGTMTIIGNFAAKQPQTISFSPPATASYPAAAIALTATASSGLPVGLILISGPATLNGNSLTLTGPGAVVVEATQAGNSQWLPALPVSASVQVAPVPVISRIRFNAGGNDSHVVDQAGQAGSTFIWTDTAGIQASPWPTFTGPKTASPVQQNTTLPAVPAPP